MTAALTVAEEGTCGEGLSMIVAAMFGPFAVVQPGDSVLHASDKGLLRAIRDNLRSTTSVCGMDGMRVLRVNDQVIQWPVQARLPDGLARCRDCWVATGKKRPRAKILRRGAQ